MDPSFGEHFDTERKREIIEREAERERERSEREGERETPNHMDPNLYEAVKNGKVDQLDQYTGPFDNQLTPNHNTILHVAAQFGDSECVAKILEKTPCHLIQVNLNKENPLHIAVRNHHDNIVQALIKGATELDKIDPQSGVTLQMLTASNVDGDTPLHLAVREGDSKIVRLLLYNHKAFQYPPNTANETPLFLAAERSDGDSMVESILACESPANTGPSRRTALHAAATSGNIESIKKLLDRNMELINQADDQGWTPLHYAAYCGDRKAVKVLLERNRSVGYIRTAKEHDESIALHIAVAAGHDGVMEEILFHCQDCWEMVNSKGQNILHIAVDRKVECVIDYIIKTDMLASLMNQKDNEGNTTLHLLASSEMKKMGKVIDHSRANMYAVNKDNKSPAEIAMSIKENNRSSWSSKARCWRNIGSNEERKAKKNEDFLMKSERKEKNKASESHMLVATLIATITITASYTIPAGYEIWKRPEGMAVLMRQPGFKAFFLANMIAVMCSTSSILCYVFAALYNDDEEKARYYLKGFNLVVVAIVAMMVGFLSNTYAMVVDSHLLIKITTFVIVGIGCLFQLRELIRFFKYILSFMGNN